MDIVKQAMDLPYILETQEQADITKQAIEELKRKLDSLDPTSSWEDYELEGDYYLDLSILQNSLDTWRP